MNTKNTQTVGDLAVTVATQKIEVATTTTTTTVRNRLLATSATTTTTTLLRCSYQLFHESTKGMYI